MIINIRGTHGCGKSTIVRSVMAAYEHRDPMTVDGRKRPVGYLCRRSYGDNQMLYVVGHYETACGGGDTVLDVETAYEYIREAAGVGYHVIFEGILLGHDVRRCAELKTTHGWDVLVIALSTDLDTCYAAVKARREARGNDRELKPDNVFKSRNSYLVHQPRRFREAGVEVAILDRDPALRLVQERLGLPLVPALLDTPGAAPPAPAAIKAKPSSKATSPTLF